MAGLGGAIRGGGGGEAALAERGIGHGCALSRTVDQKTAQPCLILPGDCLIGDMAGGRADAVHIGREPGRPGRERAPPLGHDAKAADENADHIAGELRRRLDFIRDLRCAGIGRDCGKHAAHIAEGRARRARNDAQHDNERQPDGRSLFSFFGGAARRRAAARTVSAAVRGGCGIAAAAAGRIVCAAAAGGGGRIAAAGSTA